jgi:hypothetical protein
MIVPGLLDRDVERKGFRELVPMGTQVARSYANRAAPAGEPRRRPRRGNSSSRTTIFHKFGFDVGGRFRHLLDTEETSQE